MMKDGYTKEDAPHFPGSAVRVFMWSEMSFLSCLRGNSGGLRWNMICCKTTTGASGISVRRRACGKGLHWKEMAGGRMTCPPEQVDQNRILPRGTPRARATTQEMAAKRMPYLVA